MVAPAVIAQQVSSAWEEDDAKLPFVIFSYWKKNKQTYTPSLHTSVYFCVWRNIFGNFKTDFDYNPFLAFPSFDDISLLLSSFLFAFQPMREFFPGVGSTKKKGNI